MIDEYFYDGEGRRVKKHVPATGETTVFVYDASSRLVAEYSTNLNPTPQVAYLTNDHLGGPRINTNELGAVVSRHDYRPYGEEITERTHAEYVGDTIRKQFTGYERDDETNLDHAKTRVFASGFGRFQIPDNFLNATDTRIPSGWNLYAYVLNNPLRYDDPTGEIQKDKTGKVLFWKTGEQVEERLEVVKDAKGNDVKINGKTVYVKLSWRTDTGYIKTDDGTKIDAGMTTSGITISLADKNGEALRFDSKDSEANGMLATIQKTMENAGFDATTDCHGRSFADGQVWIDNSQVGRVLKGDGYRQIDLDKEALEAGDVFVYSKDGSVKPDKVEHSVTLNTDLQTVTSKGGYRKLDTNAVLPPGQTNSAWNYNPKAVITGWTRRPKQGN